MLQLTDVYVKETIFIAFLIYFAIQDLKRRAVELAGMLLAIMLGAMLAIVQLNKNFAVWAPEVILSIIPGVTMLLFAKRKKDFIGPADGLIAIAMGLFFESGMTCTILFVASIAAGIYMQAKKRKDVAFVPFMLVAAVGVVCYENFKL